MLYKSLRTGERAILVEEGFVILTLVDQQKVAELERQLRTTWARWVEGVLGRAESARFVIGSAVYPQDGKQPVELIQQARRRLG